MNKVMKRFFAARVLALALIGNAFCQVNFQQHAHAVAVRSHAQNPEWLNYTDGRYVLAFAKDQERLWIGTRGGLLQLNADSGAKEFFTRANSALPDNISQALALDQDQNLWIGTIAGLARYDGSSWHAYHISDSGLPSNVVRALAVDQNGDLWIGTWPYRDWRYPQDYVFIGGGLAKFDGTTWTVFNTRNSPLPHDAIEALAVDAKGNLWVGTDGGAAKFDGVNWTVYTVFNSGLPGHIVSAIALQDSTVWFGTDRQGLARFEGSAWRVYHTGNSPLPDDDINAIFIDEHQNKWIATSGGLARFDDRNWAVYKVSNSDLPHDFVRNLLSADGSLWIATFDGLAQLQDNVWTPHQTSNSGLPDNFVEELVIEKNGTAWMGSNAYSREDNYGLLSFDGSEWTVYDTSNSELPDNLISALMLDAEENLWIGTLNGLAKFDRQRWTVYHRNRGNFPDVHDDWITALAVDHLGNIWAGTANGSCAAHKVGALLRFDGKEWTVFNCGNSPLPSNAIGALSVDDQNNLWIGTFEGLAKFDGENWEVFTVTNSGLPSNIIEALAIDQSNNVWVGTRPYRAGNTNDYIGGGIAKFNGTTWSVYDTSNSSLPSNWTTTLASDLEGNILIGNSSREGGFTIFDGQNWSVYNTANSSLPDNDVLTVALDQYGNRWLGTRGGGLAVFREGGIISNLDNREEAAAPRAFRLLQNYPNPFNPTTTIHYILPQASKVVLKIHNISGQEIRTLVDIFQAAGSQSVIWEGRNEAGREVGSGIYFCRLHANEVTLTRKMTLVR